MKLRSRWLYLLITSVALFFGSFYVSAQSTYNIGLTDAFHFAEYIYSITFPFIIAFTDSAKLSESVNIFLGTVTSVSDTLHFSEIINLVAPNVQRVSDTLHFAETAPIFSIQSPLQMSDVYKFVESIAVSVGQANSNPFVTQTPQASDILTNTGSTVGYLVTVVGIPMAILLAVMVIAWKEGLVWLYVLLPVIMVVIGAFAWIGIWPNFLIIIEIMLAAGGLTLIFMQLVFGSRGSAAASSE